MNIASLLTVASTLLFLFAPCFGQELNPKTCGFGGSQSEMNVCAFAKFKQADAEMNRLYVEQMAYLSADNKQRLRDSQIAWLAYRDKTCHYKAGPREQSGSIWPLHDSLCRESLTKQRNEILNKYVKCRQNGCQS